MSSKSVTIHLRRWKHEKTGSEINRPEALGHPGDGWIEIVQPSAERYQLERKIIEAAKEWPANYEREEVLNDLMALRLFDCVVALNTFEQNESPAAASEAQNARHCPRCGRRMQSDFDEDVGMWYECANCDYKEAISNAPAPPTQPEGEQRFKTLPEWTDCQSAFADGSATPLTEFIRAFEPVQSTAPNDTEADDWRRMLIDVLNFAAAPSGATAAPMITRDDALRFIHQHLHAAQWEGEQLMITFEQETLIAALIEDLEAAALPPAPAAPKCVKCGHLLLPDCPLDELGQCRVSMSTSDGDANECGCKCEFAEPVTTTTAAKAAAEEIAAHGLKFLPCAIPAGFTDNIERIISKHFPTAAVDHWCESCNSYHPIPRDATRKAALGCTAAIEAGGDDKLRQALVAAAIPYEALLMDNESRKWIAPSAWQAIGSAVIAIRAAVKTYDEKA